MKFHVLSILCLFIVGSTAIAQDCKNGQCPLVQVPKAVVSQSAALASEVASAPVKVVKQMRVKQPVRGLLKRLFRKG
jgi:hypothetical protein